MHETDPQKQLASALGRIPSGLFILTLAEGAETSGMLASWVQQCSFHPPQLTVAMGHDRLLARGLAPGAPFILNILDSTQTDMIVHFGKGFAPGAPAFTGLAIQPSSAGPPILSDALAYLECQVVSICPAGDHDLIIGRVLAGRVLDEGQPMVHIRKSGMHY
jgi:flavin reductase (DIM6/NTAB) family NADH-FMN oxidoreductase RutF